MTTEAALKAWDTRRANGWVHPKTIEKQEAEAKAAARKAARAAKAPAAGSRSAKKAKRVSRG